MKAYSSEYMKKYLDENPDKRLAHNKKCRESRPEISDDVKLVKQAEKAVRRAKKEIDFTILKSNLNQTKYDDAVRTLNFLNQSVKV